MSEKNKNVNVNPYDLSAVRRSASVGAFKTPAPMRQPYTLSSAQRLVKSTVVLRPKKSG
jgi:hypothetical protein